MAFHEELKDLLNIHCKENESDTPDFLLADYIKQCLSTYTDIVRRRDEWFGFEPFKGVVVSSVVDDFEK